MEDKTTDSKGAEENTQTAEKPTQVLLGKRTIRHFEIRTGVKTGIEPSLWGWTSRICG